MKSVTEGSDSVCIFTGSSCSCWSRVFAQPRKEGGPVQYLPMAALRFQRGSKMITLWRWFRMDSVLDIDSLNRPSILPKGRAVAKGLSVLCGGNN